MLASPRHQWQLALSGDGAGEERGQLGMVVWVRGAGLVRLWPSALEETLIIREPGHYQTLWARVAHAIHEMYSNTKEPGMGR